MTDIEEYGFWVGDCLENPQSPESTTWRLFADMCVSGNLHARAHYERMQRDWRRSAIERGEVIDADSPINTIGNFEAEDIDLSVVAPNLEANYPGNWREIARARKAYRNWQCEQCSFRMVDSGLLQVHHIDRDKSNNEKLNLQVLCAVCHGEQHLSPPVWPPGARANEMAELLAHHVSRHAPGKRPRGAEI